MTFNTLLSPKKKDSKMAKAKKKRTSRSTNKRQSVRKSKKEENLEPFFTKERIQRIIGYSMILTAIFLVVAFVSYFFTWKADQDKVLEFSWQLIMNSELEIANHLGSLGALFSHLFFYDLFGVSAFLVIGMLAVFGVNLVADQKVFKAGRISMHSLFLILWVCSLCGLLLGQHAFPFAGGLGQMIATWMTGIVGTIGLSILVVFTGGLYAYYFGNKPRWLVIPGKMPKSSLIGETGDDGFQDVLPETVDPSTDEGPETFTHHKDETFESLEKEKELETDLADEKQPYLVTKEEKEAETTDKAVELNAETKPKKKESEPDLSLEVEQTVEEKIETSKVVSDKSYDPTMDLSSFKFPTLDMLEDHGDGQIQVNKEELEENKNQIIETLSNYNIKISKIKATVGPTVTLYEIVPAPGVRISKIKNLEDDVALSLAALGIRIIAPIPGKGTIGIEVPNEKKSIVSMKYMLASEKFRKSDMTLPVAIGKTIANEIYITDLAKMPHLLMAGATGQGKSVGLNAILVSLLYKLHPSELKFVMVDPKKVELTLYKRIEKHYLAKLPGEEDPIITDTKKVIHTLNALCIEMDERYDLLKNAMVRNIKEYNTKFKKRKLNPLKGHRFLPYIVLVIDEFADLMMTAGKEVEMPIARLAQLARAIGIHLVIATQRPSVNIITGVIKANFPGRMAFKVTSKVDSRTILDASGADQLIGRGDMLFSINGNIVRLQCPFVDTPEVEKITECIGNQRGYEEAFMLPEYVDPKEAKAGVSDPLDDLDTNFEEAARIIVQHQQGSTSLIQRRLKLGYNRAGRIMDQLEAAGIVGPNAGSKAREVYIPDEYELERFLQQMGEGE